MTGNIPQLICPNSKRSTLAGTVNMAKVNTSMGVTKRPFDGERAC